MHNNEIMRIELTPTAKSHLVAFADHAGMTQLAVASRLVEWFTHQPETIQSLVLGRFAREVDAEVARLLLKQIK